MPTKHGNPWLQRQDVGDVTVVRLRLPKSVDDEIARDVFDPIYALAAEAGRKHLVLDLAAVSHLESLVLGKLVMLNRKVQAIGGRLVLCGLTPPAVQTLEHTHLTGLLNVCATEDEALASLS